MHTALVHYARMHANILVCGSQSAALRPALETSKLPALLHGLAQLVKVVVLPPACSGV